MQQIQPYLFFEGRCEEALKLYEKAVGAKVEMLLHYRDCPEPNACTPGTEDKVMHAAVQIGDSTVFFSDGRSSGKANFDGFSLSYAVKDDAEARRVFDALSEGGAVIQAPTATFFASTFAMLRDKFGLHWMILAGMKKPS
jgi:PhnB protein